MDDENFIDEIDAAVTGSSKTKKTEKHPPVEQKPPVESQARAIPAEVKLTKREMDVTLDALNRSKSHITEAAETLGSQIASLRDESLILNEVPEKLARQLRAAIPELSKEIKVQCLKDLDNGIKACYNNIATLEDMAGAAISKMGALESIKLKQTVIQIAVVVVISVLSASGSTYFMMKKFPPFVEINMTRDVQIDNSRVNVFSQKDPLINKPLDKTMPSRKK